MMPKPRSVMAHIDAIDNAHAGLQLQIQASGHMHLYGEALHNLRALVASLRNVQDARATGEFPRLERERHSRETPKDDGPPLPPARSPIVEHRRRRTRDDDDR